MFDVEWRPIAFIGMCGAVLAVVVSEPTAGWTATEDVVDYSTYGELLETYVDGEGRVDYRAWAADETDRERLDAFLERVARANPAEHRRDARLALYLNAYNAAVLDAILERWPVESPREVDGFFDEITYTIAGESRTLDALEHGVIRERFAEPRIHFVLVCAASSCPPLRRSPLRAETLGRQLERAARSFVVAATDRRDGRIVTSALFDWFGEDFESAAGSVGAYLRRYVGGELSRILADGGADVDFREYDWSVNAQPSD